MLRRLLPILPRARRWIRRTLREHRADARPVTSFGHERLGDFYPADVLRLAHVVVVESVPLPPVRDWGLPELEDLATIDASGITYRDTFFIRAGAEADESLFFHELVHVVQWRHLGVNAFLLLYALGLARHGYLGAPLEQIAYECQQRFDGGEDPFDVAATVRGHADDLVRGLRRESRLLWLVLPLLRLA